MKRLLLIIFMAGFSLTLRAQAKEQKIIELMEAYAESDKIKVTEINPDKEISPGPAELPLSSGKDQLCLPSSIKITVEDGKLLVQDSGKSNPPLYAQQDYFFLKIEDVDLELTKDEKGIVNLVIKLR